MKNRLLKCLLLIVTFLMLYPNIAKANDCRRIEASQINVKVENIDEEEIKDIWLVIETLTADEKEAYKNNQEIYSKILYDSENYDYYIIDEVEPFGKDDPTFDEYDKRNFIISTSSSYKYIYESNRLYGSNINKEYYTRYHKFEDAEDFINDDPEFFSEGEKELIREGHVTCKRKTVLNASKIIEDSRIPIENIKNGTLNYTINNYSKYNKIRKKEFATNYAIRFELKNGDYKYFYIGTNDVYLDFCKKEEINETTKQVHAQINYADYGKENLEEFPAIYDSAHCYPGNVDPCENTIYIVPIILFTIITTLIMLSVAKIMKVEANKKIIIINVLTRLFIYIAASFLKPNLWLSIINIINIDIGIVLIELLIAAVEFVALQITIREQPIWKKIMLATSNIILRIGLVALIKLVAFIKFVFDNQ